jgi:pimeloyl-ACP methyl ester carboxylesterase
LATGDEIRHGACFTCLDDRIGKHDVMSMIGSSHLTTANDTTIAWSELGSGPPLVLLHGLADSHRTWRFVAPRLAIRFHVFMLDLPGHGLSGRPDSPYTLTWYADTVARWMDAVGLDRAHLCGHSYGGGIAQWMLLEHRRRIDRLALAAAGGLGREVGTFLRLATLSVARPVLESPLFGPVSKLVMQWGYRSLAGGDEREIERLAQLNAAPNSGLAFRRTVSGCIGIRGQNVQTWHHIHKIDSLPPLALFWGGRDSIIPIDHAHEAARRLGNVTVTVYPQCGHTLHLEAAESFADDVRAFLEDGKREPAYVLSTTTGARLDRKGRRDALSASSAKAA